MSGRSSAVEAEHEHEHQRENAGGVGVDKAVSDRHLTACLHYISVSVVSSASRKYFEKFTEK